VLRYGDRRALGTVLQADADSESDRGAERRGAVADSHCTEGDANRQSLGNVVVQPGKPLRHAVMVTRVSIRARRQRAGMQRPSRDRPWRPF
jgi:hypothetical protein